MEFCGQSKQKKLLISPLFLIITAEKMKKLMFHVIG